MAAPERTSPALRFENLDVRFEQQRILEDVCAVVPSGSSTVLVGPNGAGKTTLLHCLLGIIRYGGKITVSGPDDMRVGFVPQQLSADSCLPVRVSEFLVLGLQSRPLWLGLNRRNQEKCRDTLRLVQAEHLIEVRLGALSGGELRRVLLAGALVREPHLLILDEPAAGVDVQGERLFWEALDGARRERGFTQLMVSHNLPMAAHYATHTICLNRRVIAEGPPRSALSSSTLLELFGMPVHIYPDQCDDGEDACPQCGALFSEDHVRA
ncbi:MAG: metal ABC transporter ATP-binding protein [Desulfovibrio sp.]|nr:metal ABC transporter ATP-binding protein [Desulfovibrio sp.]